MWGCYATADDSTPVENLTIEFLIYVCSDLTFQKLTLSNKQYSTWRRPLELQYQSQEIYPILKNCKIYQIICLVNTSVGFSGQSPCTKINVSNLFLK